MVLLCGLPASAARDVRPVIARIAVENTYLLDHEQVLAALGIEAGRPLDDEELAAAVGRWNDAGLLGSLSYRVEPAPEGQVEVILSVSERVQVTEVVFRGNDRFSSSRLSELIGLEPGTSVSQADVRNYERRIAAAYHEEGFPVASVHGKLTAAEPGRRELTFYVTEGPRTYVQTIAFGGNEHVEDGELRDAMESRARRWPSWLWPGWFDEAVFRRDVRAVEAAYHERGYLDAEAEGDAAFSDDMSRAALTITIREGQLYTVAKVEFEGNTLFTDAELLAA
ncbi:MAG: hypothetical protein AMK73_10045, partial [Planctomycetes bacterium SM23_32]